MIKRRSFVLSVFAACTMAMFAPAALEAGSRGSGYAQANNIIVAHAWVRPSLGSAPNTAAYMRIYNQGQEPDRLLSASFKGAEKVELHTHINDNGIMRMREVEGGIEIPAGGHAALEPGGLHVMLIGLTETLTAGEETQVELEFERAGKIAVTAKIQMSAEKSKGGSASGQRGSHSGQRGSHSGEPETN